MEIRYVHVRRRSQFGKQCVFDEWGPVVDENIYPSAELMAEYVPRNPINQAVQKSKQQAEHEMQTLSGSFKDTGMSHTEGGWPKEINHKDEEVTARYKRRVEKEDSWGPTMKALIEPMEHCVRQNNAVDIYENLFDDMIPTRLVLPLGIRTVNVYADPQPKARPVTHISWSPDHGNRFAASYCCMEFQKLEDFSAYSYLWDIENPNEAFLGLECESPSVVIEFNPRDPSMLVGGLMSGQVCNWDIRTGNAPVQMSHPQFSHRNPANQALWINSKTNSEFFSASTDGLMKWWDVRKIREPTETLVMDLSDPQAADVDRAIGVSSMNYETTIGTKFMAGMENGVVVSGTRKGKNPSEKLALRFNCHYGPVIDLDRNPFSPKNFLTIGDWTARIWAEDTRESCLFSTPCYKDFLSGGCWSTSRYSVFYVVNLGGEFQVWDLLVGMEKPVAVLRLCQVGLRAIKPHEEGKLVAVGNVAGKIFLVESSEALTTNAKDDKVLTTSLLDRGSRYEKAIDNRLKEVRLTRIVARDDDSDAILSTVVRKGIGKDKGKTKGAAKKVGKGAGDSGVPRKTKYNEKNKNAKDDNKTIEDWDEREKKKSRGKKGLGAAIADDSELAEAETRYYREIQQELDRYARIEDEDRFDRQNTVDHPTKRRQEEKGNHSERGKKNKKRLGTKRNEVSDPGYVIVKKKPDTVNEVRENSVERREVVAEDEVGEDSSPVETRKSRTPSRSIQDAGGRELRKPSTQEKPCDESVICQAKVCCEDVYSKDVEESRMRDKSAEWRVEPNRLAMKPSELLGRLSIPLQPIKEFTAEEKRRILREKDAGPDVLEKYVRRARKVIHEDLRRPNNKRLLPQISRATSSRMAEKTIPVEERAETTMNTRNDELPKFQDIGVTTRTDKKHGRLPSCSPTRVPISVFDVVAATVKTRVKRGIPKAPKLDLGYKMRNVEEAVYPRISAATPSTRQGPLPELQIPLLPPKTSSSVMEKGRKKKRLDRRNDGDQTA